MTQVYVLSRRDGRSERVYLKLRDLSEGLRNAVLRGERDMRVSIEQRVPQYRIQAMEVDSLSRWWQPCDAPIWLDAGPHETEEAAQAVIDACADERYRLEIEVEYVKPEEVVAS